MGQSGGLPPGVSTWVRHPPGSAYYVDVEPGKQKVQYKNAYMANNNFQLTFDAEAGKTYSVRVMTFPYFYQLGADLYSRSNVNLRLENGAPPLDEELTFLGRADSLP